MECADRETKNAIQLDRLKKTVETCYNKVPFYKKKFDEIGLRPEHIKTLADVKHIPFTTAEDLRNNYPFGLFAVPKRDVVRIHGSSGTTGKPKIVGYTRNDLENWSEIMARVICAAGGTAGRYSADRIRIRIVHRRIRTPLRYGKDRRDGRTAFERQHGQTDYAHAGFPERRY